jgi:hypothetical protein
MDVNPFMDRLLGMRRGRDIAGPGKHALLPLRPELCSVPGWMPFAVMGAVAHEGAYFALDLAPDDEVVTSACDMKCVRPVRLEGGPLVGTGEVIYGGRYQLTALGRAWQDDKLVAVTTSTFVRRRQ